MAEAPPIQPSPATPSPNIQRLGDVPTHPLPLLYSGPPLHVTSTLPRRLGAALRDMWAGSLIESPSGPTFIDANFDPVAAANATSFAEDRWWLSQARNRAEFDALATYAEQRRRDRAIAMENPVTHFLFSAGMDPTNVVTAGGSWIRGGLTAGQRFIRGAAVNGITVGAVETLHNVADPSVTFGDSMQAMVGGAIFGGLIGTIMRPTRPSAVGLGRYIDGQPVNAAAIGRDEGAAFLRSDLLPGETPRGRTTLGPPPAAAPAETAIPVTPVEGLPAGRGPRAQAQATFRPTAEWQDVPEGAILPPGLQIQADMTTGRQRARLAEPAARAPDRVTSEGGEVSPTFAFRPGEGARADVKATQAAVAGARTGQPFSAVLYRGTSTERIEAFRSERGGGREASGGVDAAGRGTYFGMEPGTARYYAGDAPEGARLGGVVQAVEVALRNPVVVSSIEDMKQLLELLRPVARAIAEARAKYGPDIAVDIDEVAPRLDEVLRAHGHDGLVMNVDSPYELRGQAAALLQGPDARLIERISESLIRSDHREVVVFDKGASGIELGAAGQTALMRGNILDRLVGFTEKPRPDALFQTIGRIAPADDWGTSGARPGGAAVTPTAQVTQTGEFQPRPTGLGLERLGMSPLQRLITSPIDAVGEAISRLVQIPVQTLRNLKGKANPANVESDQLHWTQRLAHVNQDYNEAFLQHRGVSGVFVAAQELAGTTPQGKLTASGFADRVWTRLHGQTDDALPEVNRAAASMRKLYDEMGDAAAEMNFFDRTTVRTPKTWHTSAGDITEGYVPRQWNTAVIKQNLAALTRDVEHWLDISGGDRRHAPEIVDGILTDRPFRAIDDEHVGKATSAYKRAFDAPSTFFARWLITDPQELLSTYVRTMGVDISLVRHTGVGGPGMVNAKPLIDNAMEEWFLEIGRRAGTDGQAHFNVLQTELARIGKETSAEYKRLEELAAAYGGTPSLSAIAGIRDRGLALKEAAMEQARVGLIAPEGSWAHMLQDLDDLKAARDLLRGTYGQWDDSMDWVPRVLAAARKIAMMTGLTGVVSQLSDVGALVLKEGLTRTFGTAVAALRSDVGTLKMALHEVQLSGTAVDMMLGGKVLAMHDLGPDISGRHTVVERVIDKATRASFYLNLMTPWTVFSKGAAGLVIGSRIADDVDKVAGQALRTGTIDLYVAQRARQYALYHMQDARSINYVPTAADRAVWTAEQNQLRRSIASLPVLTQAEEHALNIKVHEHLLANPVQLPNGRMKNFGSRADISQAKRDLARATAVDEQAMARLARAGIDPEMATEISAQLRSHQTVRDVMRLPNTERWSHSDARNAFRRAMAEDIENTIVSGDKVGRSLWLSTPIGQTLGMFQAYGQAVIQKLIIPALQEKDARLISGVALMVGAGILSDQLRRFATGNTQPSTPGEALLRGIDRSGVTGWFGQLYQAASNMSDNRFGPAFAGAPQTPGPTMPSVMGATPDGMIRALGPVASRSRDLIDLTYRTATMDWGHATARDARRLLPLNNVTHLHFAFTELERLLSGRGRMEPAVQRDTQPQPASYAR